MALGSSRSIYQIKVTLIGIKPSVWRRLLVPSSLSLGKFHDVLQIAFDWSDEHLHQFEAQGKTYGPMDADVLPGVRDESQIRLEQVLQGQRDSLIYEYDFGDSWKHKVVLEKSVSHTPGTRAPSCIGGKRACPPEDCGGVWGYAELLEAVADPFHPRHDELLDWLGDGDFDPEYFEPEEVNEVLSPRGHRA